MDAAVAPRVRPPRERRQVRECVRVEHPLPCRVGNGGITAHLETAEAEQFAADIGVQPANLPAADDLVQRASDVCSQRLVAPDRQFVNASQRELVTPPRVVLEGEAPIDLVDCVVEVLEARPLVVVPHDEVEAVRERPLQLQLERVVALPATREDILVDAVAEEVRIWSEQIPGPYVAPGCQRSGHDLLGQAEEWVRHPVVDRSSELEADARV